MSKGPYLPNLDPIIQAGIDPHTGLPIKLSTSCPTHLKDNVKRLFSIVDRQDAVNRFTWSNLPNGLTGELIERILYYKGQCIFFRMESDGNYYVLPYALSGNIDCYGRWRAVTPLPFAGGKTDGDKPWIDGLIKVPIYDIENAEYGPEDACVIIRDYTNGIEQTIMPRRMIQDPLIDLESECLPFLRTALLNSTGVLGMRVDSEDQSDAVLDASRAIDNAALTGNKYVPIVGALEFQELAGGNVAASAEFLQSMQSIDNLRLQMLGIQNGGLFQKKEHMLQEEQDLNSGSDNITMNDALAQRQSACEIINKVFGLNITVEQNESAVEETDYDVEEPDYGEERVNE